MITCNISDASNFVDIVDTSFYVILGIISFFLVAITFVLILFVFKYRKTRNPKATQIKGSVILEIIWTIIPLALVMVMFYYGWMGYRPMKDAPDDSFNIEAVGRMWSWKFNYPNGKSTDTLLVPLNRNIKLDLKALDVIHSLYIPAFRIKQDMVPGKTDFMWFRPSRKGDYELFCTEYCGLRHSSMLTSVKVLDSADFYNWYVDTTAVRIAKSDKPGALGFQIAKKNGCLVCHSVDGSKLVGPSWKGLYGGNRKLKVKGKKIEQIADSAYIVKSIYYPNDEIVDGYSKGLMLSYKNELKPEDISEIIKYLKTLTD
ncbi:MAG: cytochrome c oxidase subunit II [Marinifilaceae bacterium]|jgi:cytochrome c oxidase subunit 2|nr:cytochrome c oxidase subunit II [Marinifilaceae bacterium]